MSAEATPAKVLTKSQMKRAARSGKARTRNVLFHPFRIEWPPVARQAAADVLAAVATHVRQFDICTSVDQDEYVRLLAAGRREEITAARQRARAAAAPLLEARRRYLADCVVGFNAVSRALEAGALAALLVEAETPALETSHLAPLAAGRLCPAVRVPRLRPALEARLGLQTAVFGLRSAVADAAHPLHPLYVAVRAAAAPLAALPAACANPSVKRAEPEPDQPAAESDASPATPPTAPPPSPPPPPLQQADFISFGPVDRKRTISRQQVVDQLDSLMCIDTVGVPHRKRLALKAARVMTVTLGNKQQKKAAKQK